MRALGILALLFVTNMASAGFVTGNFGGARGMEDYNSNSGSYGAYGQTGENTGNAGFLSCACATRINLNNTQQDPACDYYSRMHQNMIINPGSAAPAVAPANPQMFHM